LTNLNSGVLQEPSKTLAQTPMNAHAAHSRLKRSSTIPALKILGFSGWRSQLFAGSLMRPESAASNVKLGY
jgi:hypothetical protein